MKTIAFASVLVTGVAVAIFGQSLESKTIRLRRGEIPTINCSQGQVCEIDFDGAEQIMKAPLGDSKDWAAAFLTDAAKNHLLIKTLTEGKDNPCPQTSMHVIMQSGNVYSFQLVDVSRTKTPPDLRVSVELADDGMKEATAHPKYVTADALKLAEDEVARVKAQLEDERRKSQAQVAEQIERFKRDFPKRLLPQYEFSRNNPFGLEEIARLDDYTLLWFRHPSEIPALYEIRDGKPSLVEAKYDGGLMIVPAPLTDGYLAVGKKQKTVFHWKGN
ncbi:MAG: TrbG/VirB9 family P-type conjugative transfer protein [Bryobacteraceae bacterium]